MSSTAAEKSFNTRGIKLSVLRNVMNLECEKWIKHIIARRTRRYSANIRQRWKCGERRNRISISREIYTCRERGSRAINSFYSKHLFAIYVLSCEHRENLFAVRRWKFRNFIQWILSNTFSLYRTRIERDRRVTESHDLCSWFPSAMTNGGRTAITIKNHLETFREKFILMFERIKRT